MEGDYESAYRSLKRSMFVQDSIINLKLQHSSARAQRDYFALQEREEMLSRLKSEYVRIYRTQFRVAFTDYNFRYWDKISPFAGVFSFNESLMEIGVAQSYVESNYERDNSHGTALREAKPIIM